MADQEEKVEQQEEAPAEATEAAEEATETAEEATGEPEAQASADEPSADEAAGEAEAAAPAEAEESAPESEAEAPAAPAEPEGDQPELTFEVLHKMTVAELRDVAQGLEHDALAGYSTMHKEQLVPALCEALGIEAHVHHEVVGINKDRVKAKIRELKVERAQAVEAGDHAQLKLVRSRIKSLKRKIRRATV